MSAGMSPDNRVIAVVDDDEAVCDSTRFLLETHDFEVATYLSGSDFLRDSPDVACVIVDYQMPRLNGFELVSTLLHGSAGGRSDPGSSWSHTMRT